MKKQVQKVTSLLIILLTNSVFRYFDFLNQKTSIFEMITETISALKICKSTL